MRTLVGPSACPSCRKDDPTAGRYCLSCGANLDARAARVETLQVGLLVVLAIAALVLGFTKL